MKKKKFVLTLVVLLIIFAFLNIPSFAKKIYPYKHKEYVENYSKKYGVDPYLVAAVIKSESNFNEYATSHKDAHGLMQFTPETARWVAKKMEIQNFNEDMLYDPKTNISMGCWYIKDLQKEFNNEMDLVLAAYNAGRGNVSKWLKDSKHSKDGKTLYYIPFKETDKYVKKVKVSYSIYKALYGEDKKTNLELIRYMVQNVNINK